MNCTFPNRDKSQFQLQDILTESVFFCRGFSLRKVALWIVLAITLICSTDVNAVEYVDEFLGGYLGLSMGMNNARSTGTLKSQSERTIAYLIQGGYIQGGYNYKFSKYVLGVGGYADMNAYELHKNKLAYGSLVYGLNVKVATPVEHWLPYARLGYGYGSATSDLRSVSGVGLTYGIGAEYKYSNQWSAVVEYKASDFTGNSTTVKNKAVLFGLNYYFDKPVVIEDVVDEVDYAPLEVIEEAPPEFAPPI